MGFQHNKNKRNILKTTRKQARQFESGVRAYIGMLRESMRSFNAFMQSGVTPAQLFETTFPEVDANGNHRSP